MASLNRIADVSLKGTLNASQAENAYLKERYADVLERERVLLERLTEAEALLLKVLPELSLALREWRMFSDESKENRDIDHDRDTEAEWYRHAVHVRGELQKAVTKEEQG